MAELVALRLALPARLHRQPLDELLASLTPAHSVRADALDWPSFRRDVLRVEHALYLLRWPWDTCLYRVLARYAVLRRNGMEATFVMAVGPGGVEDDGHAWIELDGAPFEEPKDLSRYAVTFRFAPGKSAKSEAI